MKSLVHKFLLISLFVGIALVSLISGCANQIPNAPSMHYFRMNLGTEPPTLDPVEVNDLVSMTVLTNIMRGLTQYGANGQIVPCYATHWTVSPDGKHYVFYLRKNGHWSDGNPVTAEDFVYAWQRVLNPKNGSSYAFLLFDLHNARAFYNGKIKDPNQLGFRAVDNNTLSVDLDRPIAYFLQIMAFSISLPERKDVIEKYANTFTEAGHYITNGPYTLAQWDHENQIMLKPNPMYWAGAPKNVGIQMFMIPEPNTSLIMYENNELDFAETASSLPAKEVRRLRGRKDYHFKTLHGISYFGYNTQKPPFNDVRVRQAFSHAFDRTYIPKLFQSGEAPITSWISPGLFAYNPNIGLGFDLNAAQKLLAEAGYPGGKGFPKVEIWYASTTPENRQMAEIAQFQWQHNLHVPVELKNVEWKVYLKQLDQDPPQIFRLQWYVDYPDPDSFMNVFISESGNNYTRWKSTQYDHWVQQAAITLNPAARKALYDKAQRLLLEDTAAITPLYVMPKSYLLKPNITGFALDSLNIVRLDQVEVH